MDANKAIMSMLDMLDLEDEGSYMPEHFWNLAFDHWRMITYAVAHLERIGHPLKFSEAQNAHIAKISKRLGIYTEDDHENTSLSLQEDEMDVTDQSPAMSSLPEAKSLLPKSEELKARLKKLQELVDRKEYAELVKDITSKERTDEPFSSYKDQLGFGLHVVVTMFTGYLVGYAAFRALFSHNPVMIAAGGILGLVGAMLVETLLFIIRAANQEKRTASSTSLLKKNQ